MMKLRGEFTWGLFLPAMCVGFLMVSPRAGRSGAGDAFAADAPGAVPVAAQGEIDFAEKLSFDGQFVISPLSTGEKIWNDSDRTWKKIPADLSGQSFTSGSSQGPLVCTLNRNGMVRIACPSGWTLKRLQTRGPTQAEELIQENWKKSGTFEDSGRVEWTVFTKACQKSDVFSLSGGNRYGCPVVILNSVADELMEQLVAPIALCPDSILANILAASTCPEQLRQAYLWIGANPHPNYGILETMNWEPAVKALVHYPVVLQGMMEDLHWTNSLGAAFFTNQADLMAAIQFLRARAISNGNLLTSLTIEVVLDGGQIYIQPANPQIVCFPSYDPFAVFNGRYVVAWDAGHEAGPWLHYGLDWGGNVVWSGDWQDGWTYEGHRWHRNHDWHPHRNWEHDDQFGKPPELVSEQWKPPVTLHGRKPAQVPLFPATRPAKTANPNGNKGGNPGGGGAILVNPEGGTGRGSGGGGGGNGGSGGTVNPER